MASKKRQGSPLSEASYKDKSNKRRNRDSKEKRRAALQTDQDPTRNTAHNRETLICPDSAPSSHVPLIDEDDTPSYSQIDVSRGHSDSTNAPVACSSTTLETAHDMPKISSIEISNFWQKNFHIRNEFTSNPTNENTVIQMFLDQHPRFQNVNNQYFKRHFQQMTHSEVPQIRRFKKPSVETHFYSAELFIDNNPVTNTAQTQVKFSLLNTQGLINTQGRNKSKSISDLILDPSSQHIIALTETFLTEDVEEAEILKYFPSYTLNRGDRDTQVGRKHKQGGCLLLTSPQIPSIKIDNFSNGTCEALTTTHPTLDLTIITAYRPPDTTKSEFDDLLTYIDTNLSTNQSSHTIITGDFNFPKEIVTWIQSQDGIIPVPARYVSDDRKLQLQKLLDIVDRHFLHQIVNLSTH